MKPAQFFVAIRVTTRRAAFSKILPSSIIRSGRSAKMQRVAVVGRRAFSAAAAPKEPLWALREMGRFGRWMRDQPNAVPETQKFFTHASGPTYVKKDSDKMVMMIVASVMGAGAVMGVAGLCSAARPPRRRAVV